MSDSGFDFSGIEPILFPHEFEEDLTQLVIANHQFTLEGINRFEEESVDYDMPGFFEDLRAAANNLAVVALIIRLDHWLRKCAATLKIQGGNIMEMLKRLNQRLDDGPVPIAFFQDLVNVRDCVVHGDSKATWSNRDQRVSRRYVNDYGRVALNEEQVKEAITKTIQQVQWYDARRATVISPANETP